MPYQKEIKGIRLLQDRSDSIAKQHQHVHSEIEALKEQLELLGPVDPQEVLAEKESILSRKEVTPLLTRSTEEILLEAIDSCTGEKIGLRHILTQDDFEQTQSRIDSHILEFNKRHNLDTWDYAIAGSCGLFAAMLDLLCVKAPEKPTTAWTKKVDGIFNAWVQEAFNTLIPPELSEALSQQYSIGAPDSSTISQLINAPRKALNPLNHRLRALSHDPVLGIIFGVLDMLHGTCTTVVKGKIVRIPGKNGPTEGSIVQLIGKMLGHLLSDVNAPSAKGNRGMGLPAPFMGLLRMFENIPVGESDFGKQIEWMYVNGYDFRQFVVTSIPMAIMEALLRACYTAKQISVNNASFKEVMLETLPTKMSPRFRIILALAYGTSSSVNAGKVYVTQNILNANYTSWMGLAWNSFHALRWSLYSRHMALWNSVEEAEIKELESLLEKIGIMEERAARLPVR